MASLDKVNVLLVDDQPAKLLSYEVILAGLGHNLLKASSAREALEILLKNEVAVVLTDVCMPELDGFELVTMLRQHPRYEHTAVIFISAVNLSEEDRARGYRLGAVDYVSVPVVPEILRAKLQVFADLYRKTKELEQLNAQLEERVKERTLELEQANLQLRESEERLRLASEAAEFGTYDYNVETDNIHCSAHLRRLLGTDLGEDMSFAEFLALVHPNDRAAVETKLKPAGEVSGRHEIEFRSAASSGRWLLDRGRTFRGDGAGSPPHARTMGTVLHITVRKQLEERQKLLIAELDHRVKNVMANVTAMARLSGRSATSIDLFVQALEGRLQSMASAHSLLRQSNWSSAELEELAMTVLAPFRSAYGDNIALRGQSLRLRPRAAQDLALVLHELATNAVKHGALSQPEGAVSLSWSHNAEDDTTLIVWKETGGPLVRKPERRGLGLTILEASFADGGMVDCAFAEGGFVCTIKGRLAGVWWGGFTASKSSKAELALPALTACPPLRILLVEDEPLLALQLQCDLEQSGHAVIGPASTLSDGVRLAQSPEFDVALLDINLGREISADIAVLLTGHGIPFVFLTGYADGAALPEHLRDSPRLSKPCVVTDVLRMIATLVQKPTSDRAAAERPQVVLTGAGSAG